MPKYLKITLNLCQDGHTEQLVALNNLGQVVARERNLNNLDDFVHAMRGNFGLWHDKPTDDTEAFAILVP